MNQNYEKEYDECMEMVHLLMRKWEKIRPDEELVVMALPKCDRKTREKCMNQIHEMLLREEW